ncbi:MAG TPA: phosphoribosylformylglycinamidine synthase subunit PurS [Dehalococcoidia bacterium]|jgi:phosphoribosylformylglycinamidine synthase|nr:phosphoribosylformylglycinamidine synthase subunit PurS [Dehalococcoidia bacterium]
MAGPYLARINVMLKALVNDPQGLTVLDGLKTLGFDGIDRVRIGKRIEVTLDAGSEDEARQAVAEMCDRLLANPVLEEFSFEISEA